MFHSQERCITQRSVNGDREIKNHCWSGAATEKGEKTDRRETLWDVCNRVQAPSVFRAREDRGGRGGQGRAHPPPPRPPRSHVRTTHGAQSRRRPEPAGDPASTGSIAKDARAEPPRTWWEGGDVTRAGPTPTREAPAPHWDPGVPLLGRESLRRLAVKTSRDGGSLGSLLRGWRPPESQALL